MQRSGGIIGAGGAHGDIDIVDPKFLDLSVAVGAGAMEIDAGGRERRTQPGLQIFGLRARIVTAVFDHNTLNAPKIFPFEQLCH